MEGVLNDSPISFTKGALAEIQRILQERRSVQNQPWGLRMGVNGGGCAGMSYIIDIDERKEGDVVFEAGKIEIFMSPAHLLYLDGMEVDYQTGLSARGFTFKNPNAATTCGCGSSFGI